jgi:aryl-alcohol dehydrogenase-like predicted oxidoreductase
MHRRPFGTTGLYVSALGFGAGGIGDARLSEDHVGTLLNRALDLGVTFFDTARGYGLSEERIGRHLAHRRGDFVLSTKGGYGVDGVADWTGEVIARGVDEALRRMHTDVIDVFFLHSCPKDVLDRGEVVRALDDARCAGKIRVAAYSGENDSLASAAVAPVFGAIQCSVNACDQRSLLEWIPRASARGAGVVGKRPIANAPWRFSERPAGQYCEAYWERLRTMGGDALRGDHAWLDFMLRFSAFAPGVSTAILGTTSLANLEAAVRCEERGPLDDETVRRAGDAFRAHGANWEGLV